MGEKYTVRGKRWDGRDYVEWEDLKAYVRLEQQRNPGLTVDELIERFEGGVPVQVTITSASSSDDFVLREKD